MGVALSQTLAFKENFTIYRMEQKKFTFLSTCLQSFCRHAYKVFVDMLTKFLSTCLQSFCRHAYKEFRRHAYKEFCRHAYKEFRLRMPKSNYQVVRNEVYCKIICSLTACPIIDIIIYFLNIIYKRLHGSYIF